MLIFGEKMLMSADVRMCVTWFIYFLDLLQVRYNCAKFHHCWICVTDIREGGPFCSPNPWAAPKMPIRNRVKVILLNNVQFSFFWKLILPSFCRFSHSHKKPKDSLETRAVLIEISMLCWNLPSGTKHRGSL